MSIRYRPEIDGLRTVAVVSVLIYHAKIVVGGIDVVGGGFIGVDIFFVISGFLITSLIYKEWQDTGRFSIANFYERRARRLLPALFIVIFASWLVAWFLLLPNAMVDMVKSQLASVFFISNMYWWDASQVYGARSGLLEPFLHTWSLAVEEQFYLVFPLIFIACLRRASLSFILKAGLVTILLGLIFAQVFSTYKWNLSFYWLPSRVWELMAGAVLAIHLARASGGPRNPRLLALMPPLGLAMIVVSLLVMDVTWNHPGLATVPSVLGTVLIIWFANDRDPVTRLLSSRLFVGIGLISYSLYLWHYPVFAFARMADLMSSVTTGALVFLSPFLLAYLSYRFIERPFRQPGTLSLKGLSVWLGASTVAVLAFTLTMISTDGLRDRLTGLIALYGQNEFDNQVLRDESWQPLAELAAAQGLGPSTPRVVSEFEAGQLWPQDDGTQTRVLIVGDSHAKDMFNALTAVAQARGELAVSRFAMGRDIPAETIALLRQAPNYDAADVVALSFRISTPALPDLDALITRMKEDGKQVALMSRSVEFRVVDDLPVFDWYLQRSGQPYDATAIEAMAWEWQDLQQTVAVNERLAEIAERQDVPFLIKRDFICNSETQSCDVITEDGQKVFYDHGHYTLDGARYFGGKILASGWLDPALALTD